LIPFQLLRANLGETNYVPQDSGGEMAAKRLAVLAVLLVVVLGAVGWAQVNDASITVGRTFVSTQTVPSTGLPIHFGNAKSVAFNYGRLLRSYGIFGLSAELPVAVYPRMNLNYNLGLVPKDIGAVFVTPSVRVNIFSGERVSPWVSVGGGYAHFREAPTLTFDTPNPGRLALIPGPFSLELAWTSGHGSAGARAWRHATFTPGYPTTTSALAEAVSITITSASV
jgi:hypothetical protein